MMGKRGRPTKFNPALAAEVLKAISAGMLLQDAAEYAGVDRHTLHRWLEEGDAKRDPHHPLAEFCATVSKGRGGAKFRAVSRIHLAMAKDWRAAAWWLGVTDPRNYGPKVRVTLVQEFSDALERVRGRLSPEVYEQVLSAIAEGGGGLGIGEDSPGAVVDLGEPDDVQPAPAGGEAEGVSKP